MNGENISGKFVVTAEKLDCVRLVENGCLVIAPHITELTIDRLINDKKGDALVKYEFLIAGAPGEDGEPGQNGTNGKNGGNVKITIKDLINSVMIKSVGGQGGSGGKGVDGVNDGDGGDGGNGGNGGNGGEVEFYYFKGTDSFSYADGYSVGGEGGNGGSGGRCHNVGGKGGEAGLPGTKGAKCGDGGTGGANGNDGRVLIHHPNGGLSMNGFEYDVTDSQSPNRLEGTRMLNLGSDRDARIFLRAYGGERHLRKYPELWKGFIEARKAASDKSNPVNPDIKIAGSISQVEKIGVNKDGEALSNQTEDVIYTYYKLDAHIQTSLQTASNKIDCESMTQKMIGYTGYVTVKYVDSGQILYRCPLQGIGDVMRSLDHISNDEAFHAQKVVGKKLVMDAVISYIYKDDQDIRQIVAATIQPKYFEFKQEETQSFIEKITITEPHWKSPKKSGEIMFLYGRTPSQSSPTYNEADYYDSDGLYFKNKNSNGILRTIIPICGVIKLRNAHGAKVTGVSFNSYMLEDGYCPHSTLDYKIDSSGAQHIAMHHKEKATFRADGSMSGSTLHTSLVGTKYIKLNEDNTVDFNLNLFTSKDFSESDWNHNLAGRFVDNSIHKCYLNGCFVLKVEHEPLLTTEDIYAIYIYSDDSLPKGHTYYESQPNKLNVYIPCIMIYWGCYGKETLLRTADGAKKRADEIQQGDRICVFGGKVLTVKSILTGDDTEIFNIKTTDGNNIRVSGGHAMKLFDEHEPEGIRMSANKIKKYDRLMTPYGTSEVDDVAVEPYNDKVYNFTFEEDNLPNYIEANGYWSGDFQAQNQMRPKKPAELTKEEQALIAEIQALSTKV